MSECVSEVKAGGHVGTIPTQGSPTDSLIYTAHIRVSVIVYDSDSVLVTY